ncbi:MAG: pilin [Chloroflexi bacterium]|nr:pilin [Chloroflexota bacterium]
MVTSPLALAQAGPNPTPDSSTVTLTNPLCTGGQANCQNSTATGLIKNIVGWIFTLATPIAVGMIIVGALQMVTAAGSEDKFSTGKRTVLYAVIGYAIILIGWGITSIIQSILG